MILRQFQNPANPEVHYRTTGEEIWRDTDGKVDILVSGIGTGGTASGAGKRLKGLTRLSRSMLLGRPTHLCSREAFSPHKIQGIGAGFIPDTYNGQVIDKVLTVSNDDAIRTGRKLASREGLLAGISSGAAVAAALRLAQKAENAR